jgi:gamma-glutamylcyclotransferase (GGCT)/AIG2-like uncharacterized protein YtfP
MGRGQRARLAREGRVLGAATLQGQLYDLGRYPGVTDSPDPADLVHGELIELLDAAASLLWLDAYEGIRPGATVSNEYVREERLVQSAEGAPMSAWVYLYCRDASRMPRILDGRWPG